MGLEAAAEVFREVREGIGLPVLTDVHLPDQCERVAEIADILQIPAFLCRQSDLLMAAAETGRAINVKKGQFLAPWDMRNVIDKLVQFGARDIMVTERGASFGYNTLVSDMRAIPELRANGVSVIFDATHSVQQPGGQGVSSGGQRDFAPVLGRAAVAVGVAGVFIETHQDPDNAPSDGPNMIRLDALEGVLKSLAAFDKLNKSLDLPAVTMRVLIAGAAGQVAQSMTECAKSADIDTIALGRPTLDLTAPEVIDEVIDRTEPNVVVNAAAYTAVDKAESDEAAAYAINADGAGALAIAAAQCGLPLIHLSTDYVFDGAKSSPYAEGDPVAPLGVYGKSKTGGRATSRRR